MNVRIIQIELLFDQLSPGFRVWLKRARRKAERRPLGESREAHAHGIMTFVHGDLGGIDSYSESLDHYLVDGVLDNARRNRNTVLPYYW